MDELGAPLARIVAGYHDRRLVAERGLIGHFRRYRSPLVGLVDGGEVRRERRRPLDQTLVEFQPFRLVEADRSGDPALAAVRSDESAVRRRALRDDDLVSESGHSNGIDLRV